MATKLGIINGALRHLRNGKLSASEVASNGREAARLANDIYDDGFVRGCLEDGAWRFAIRARQITADPGIDPRFDGQGLKYAFEKSSDWVRTVGIYIDAHMGCPHDRYFDEAGYLFSDLDTLYVRHVSDDASFGGNLAIWPRSFADYAEFKLASRMAGPLTGDGKDMMEAAKQVLSSAKGIDVLNEPTRQMPHGSWVRARFGGTGYGRFGSLGYPRF